MSTSSEELGLDPELRKAVRAEVKKVMVGGASASATERMMKPGKKRPRTQPMELVMKPGKKLAMEQVTELKEQVTEQVTELTERVTELMERVTEQVTELTERVTELTERVTEQVTELTKQVRVIKRNTKRKRKVVKDPQGARTSLDPQITRSEVREYHLLFVNKLHDIIYTKDNITDEDGGSVQIQLIDDISGEIEKIGPLSSIEIQIVVLEGNLGFESHESWTEQEFNDKIIPERGDHKPLVIGEQNIRLREGVGSIDDLKFSVNSNWTNCKKFRLGARVLQSRSNVGQMRIREAITEAFTVRDQRGKMSHLEKIKKGGKFHKALIDNDIRSGSKLKEMYKNDPGKLKMILEGCSKWEWEVIVHHGPRVLDDANSNPSRSKTATTGSTEIVRAPSTQHPAVNSQNPASQPPYIPYLQFPANAPLAPSNDSPGLCSSDQINDFLLSWDDNQQ